MLLNYMNEFGGEMSQLERKTLYEWVLSYNPFNILEIGTGTGGGGCYYMAKALKVMNSSTIYTCDPSRGPEAKFFNECPNVTFYPITSNQLIDIIIDHGIIIEFIFFDGPEDENVAYDDILKLETHIKPGTKFSMHDWETEPRILDGAISNKAKKIRPYMESSTRWKLLYKTENSYESVGLCLYEFLG